MKACSTFLAILLVIPFPVWLSAAYGEVDDAARFQLEQTQFTLAKSLTRAEDADAAEHALLALSRSQPDSFAWQMEIARRLVFLANDHAREGRPEASRMLIEKAAARLALAEARAADSRQRFTVKSFLGFVRERYLADPAGARASYEEAAALMPTSRAVKDRLEQLQRAEESKARLNQVSRG